MAGHRSSCLLLVDDDDIVRETLCLLLEDDGFKVTAAGSANEALAMVDDGLEVGVAVTDFDLGHGLSGGELADRLHRRRPSLPVIFITGLPGSLMERYLGPREALLLKPFAARELSGLVRRMASLDV